MNLALKALHINASSASVCLLGWLFGLCDRSANDCQLPSYRPHHRFTLLSDTPYFAAAALFPFFCAHFTTP
jgi:hypothetical protein